MPTPAIKHDDTRDPKQDIEYCPDCDSYAWRGKGHHCTPPTQTHVRRSTILALVIIAALMLAGLLTVHSAQARQTNEGIIQSFDHAPRSDAAPAALVAAREQCPLDKPLACRAALVHALAAVTWQRGENLKLARAMVGNVGAWSCIHGGEGSWTAHTGNGYYGGLQMDRGFMATYGSDMIRRHHGAFADHWTPREQLIVAQRAYAQGRGYNPWPNTGRACGLIP